MGKASELTLGWKVDSSGDPVYWANHQKWDRATSSDLVNVSAENIATSAIIVAQSGSGKSFFLGRLIEEIATKTLAKCLILDPNSDFKRINELQPESFWSNAGYRPDTRGGVLPTESRDEFSSRWKDVVHPLIFTGESENEYPYSKLELWWPSLSSEIFSGGLSATQRGQLYHCHAFVKAITALSEFERMGTRGDQSERIDPISLAENIYQEIRHQAGKGDLKDAAKQVLQLRFGGLGTSHTTLDKVTRTIQQVQPFPVGELYSVLGFPVVRRATPINLESRIDRLILRASTAVQYFTEEMAQFYFGTANEYKSSGILSTNPPESRSSTLQVIDLPSFPDKNVRLLSINSKLEEAWSNARALWIKATESDEEDKRVPTFIVVDEAHNLMPSETESAGSAEIALRDQFRTISAEGRKFGLFLILVTQRPDKLDPKIVSECENKAVMRVDSESVLAEFRQMLGLQDASYNLLERCVGLRKGRAILCGRWTREGAQMLYAAARRTKEGGKNLKAEYWAVSPKSLPLPSETNGSNVHG